MIATGRVGRRAGRRDGRGDVQPRRGVPGAGHVHRRRPTRPSDYTGQDIYYRSLRRRTRDALTTYDYLWRWDTDWFWCSAAFGVQHPVVRRLWPARYRRSDVYHRLVRLEHRHQVAARVDRWRGRPARERVVQDVEIPLDGTADFLRWFARRRAGCPRSGSARCGCASRPAPDRHGPGRCIRSSRARPTSTSASGGACRSPRAPPTATSTGRSSARCRSRAGTSRSTRTRTTTGRRSTGSTAARPGAR